MSISWLRDPERDFKIPSYDLHHWGRPEDEYGWLVLRLYGNFNLFLDNCCCFIPDGLPDINQPRLRWQGNRDSSQDLCSVGIELSINAFDFQQFRANLQRKLHWLWLKTLSRWLFELEQLGLKLGCLGTKIAYFTLVVFFLSSESRLKVAVGDLWLFELFCRSC